MQTINILEKPTFDITDWEIINKDKVLVDNTLFCQSKQVFQFNNCKGNILPRSRILRQDKQESQYVQNVISAVIDAGFIGRLVWKIILTNAGAIPLKELENVYVKSDGIEIGRKYTIYATHAEYALKTRAKINPQKLTELLPKIQNSVQIDLNPFPTNYYNGTNQTDLEPDIIFTQL